MVQPLARLPIDRGQRLDGAPGPESAPSGRLIEPRSQSGSPTDGLPGMNSLAGGVKLAARDQPHDPPGKTGSADDPALGVVVQSVALAGFTLVLGLDSLLARGGYLKELVLVGMDAAHGGEFLRVTVSWNSRQGAKSGQIHWGSSRVLRCYVVP